MLDRILVPLNGSKADEGALKVVRQIPSRRIQLFSVEPDCTDLSEMYTKERDCEASLETVASPLREQGRYVTTMVALGNPAEQINAMADGVDLIVMSGHRHGAPGRVLFCSVADSVARNAPAPTLLVRVEEGRAVALKRIGIPLDGSVLAEQALPLAVSLAKDMGLPLHLVRVVDFDADWQRVMDFNLTGVFRCAQAVARVMIAGTGSPTINIASILGALALEPVPAAPYVATKGALVNLTRDLAIHWASHGILVYAIGPVYFPSEMTDGCLAIPEIRQEIERPTPLERVGRPEKLKGVVALLASLTSSYITGQTLYVDGDWTAW